MISRNQYPNFTLRIASLLSLLLLMSPLSLFSQNSSPPSPDFDGSGTVDIPDYLLFVNAFGSKEGEEKYDAKYDLDGNGEIGISDFLLFMDSFGKTVNSDNEESTSGGSSGSSGGNSGGSSSGGTSPRDNPPTPPSGQQQVIPQVTISEGTTPVTEGTAATFTITASSAPTTAITVSVSVTEDGDVISGTLPSSVTINANESTATLTVSTDDDNVGEINGIVTAEVATGTGYTVGRSSSASVTVQDDDLSETTIVVGTTPVTEGTDVVFTIIFPSTITLPQGGLSIDIDDSGDVMSGEVLVSRTQNATTLTIKTIDDDVDEPNSVVTLTAQWEDKIKMGEKIGSPFSASVTVEDND